MKTHPLPRIWLIPSLMFLTFLGIVFMGQAAREALVRVQTTNTITSNTGVPVQVETIAALKAATVAYVTNGQKVHVVNYATANDGGGGDFYYSSASSATDNGGTVIAPNTGTGRWIRLVANGFAEARWFGAKGDATTDDSAKLQAAIDWMTANGGGVVSISGMRLRLASSVTVKQGVSLRGALEYPDARDASTLTGLGGTLLLASGTTLNMDPVSSIRSLIILKYGMTFPQDAAAVATWADTAVTVKASSHAIYIGHAVIVGFARAVDMGTATFTEQTRIEYAAIDALSGVKIVSGTDRISLYQVECWPTAAMGLASPVDADYQRPGIGFELAAGTFGIDAPSLARCFTYGYLTGFKLNSVNGASLVDCAADYTVTKTGTVRGIHITGDTTVTQLSNTKVYRSTYGIVFSPNNANHGLLVSNCSIEYADTAGIYITSGFASITGNLIRNYTSYTTYGIQVHNASGSSRVIVTGNLFDYGTNAYAITGTTPGDVIVADDTNVVTGNGTNIFLGGGLNTYPSSATLTIPADASMFYVSGTDNISAINASFARAGRRVTLIFTNSLTLVHSSSFRMKSGSNKSVVANDNVTFGWDGSAWREL